VFFFTGQYDRALEFTRLDAGSEMSNNVEAMILLRRGKTPEALETLRQLPDSTFFHTRALEACYTTPRPRGSDVMLQRVAGEVAAYHDPEPRFSQAILFNACLGNDFTAKLVKAAIDDGYCAYDYLQLDPLLAEFRKSPQYPAILAQAKRCRDRFVAERSQARY